MRRAAERGDAGSGHALGLGIRHGGGDRALGLERRGFGGGSGAGTVDGDDVAGSVLAMLRLARRLGLRLDAWLRLLLRRRPRPRPARLVGRRMVVTHGLGTRPGVAAGTWEARARRENNNPRQRMGC